MKGVLIIDECLYSHELYKQLFDGIYKINIHASPIDAIQELYFNHDKYDAVITEYCFSNMSCRHILSLIKSQYSNIKVILMTRNESPIIEGFDGYIDKKENISLAEIKSIIKK